jgi:putative ABC transport system ATP-binding protein
MSVIIELRDVWKVYKMGAVYVNALRGLSLKVRRGEFVAIQGPSGCGKSTTMNMIGCLDVPTRGEVYLDARNISELSESSLASIRGKKIGFVFQQFNLINTLSALENVTLPMIFQGVPKEKRESRARQLLERVELGNRMNHKPNELSGGEQQRIAIARALANDPELVLADEPTGNLDSKTGENVINFLKRLHKEEKKTIIVVTHDQKIARQAERTAYLKDGVIVKSLR